MKSLNEFLLENVENQELININEEEETIKDEESFREYAENKFKEVFGDDLDEDKMKEVIDGIIKDNKDAIDNGDWGELVGILNKSFGSKQFEKMDDIQTSIQESGEYEMLDREYKLRNNSKYFWFNTETEVCGFMSQEDITNMVSDDEDFASDAEIIMNLPVGEVYSPDGGINQYVRFKK